MDKKEKNQKIMLYLINKLGKNSEGKKKLMKLMFLLEHYDFDKDKLLKTCSVGNSFNIYYYGVFSREVQICFDELFSNGQIEGNFPSKSIETKKEFNPGDVEENVREKIDKVVDKFGEKSGYFLEVETLRMMNIEPCDKEKYFGKSVCELIV